MGSSGHPYHMIGRSFGDPIAMHAQMQQPGGYGMALFFPPLDQYAWPGPHQGQGLVKPNLTSFGSPFDRLDPANQAQSTS